MRAMVAARPVLLAAAALGLTGCAELVGVEDPVAEFGVSPLIEDRYLLVVDAETSLGVGEIWRFEVSLSIDDRTDRTVVMTWTALDQTEDRLVGSEQVFTTTLENAESYDFEIEEFVLVVDPEATLGGIRARLDGSLDGHFPILPPVDVASTASFCGTIDGAFTEPTKGTLSGVSFGALIIEDDAPLPMMLRPSCVALGE
jgi:hypothetical protein